jgi:hypothetical protein
MNSNDHKMVVGSSVGDPDPHVFRSPGSGSGSGSISQRYGSGSIRLRILPFSEIMLAKYRMILTQNVSKK